MSKWKPTKPPAKSPARKLTDKVARRYEREGMDSSSARRIGGAVAGKVCREKHGQSECTRRSQVARKARKR